MIKIYAVITWNGETLEEYKVESNSFYIDNGHLIFTDEIGGFLAAFAPSSWYFVICKGDAKAED
jgi:hypothetical protein